VQKKLNRKTETAVHFVKAETEQKPQFFLQNSIKSHFFANRTPLLCVLSDNSGLFSICFYVSQIFTNTRAKLVRRDRSSPVKKNTQIFLVAAGVVIWFSSVQSAADHALFYK